MPINTEMFQRIEQIIRINPEQHSQKFFEMAEADVWLSEPHCGTTRCIAGWAIHLWGADNGITNAPIEVISKEYAEQHDTHRLIKEHYADDPYGMGGTDRMDAEVIASHILGIPLSDGQLLFFDMDDRSALDRVARYASGQDALTCEVEGCDAGHTS